MWHEHSPNTWVIQDKRGRVIALVHFKPSTGLYSAQRQNKALGLYITLEAAQSAALSQCSIKKFFQTKPQKTVQDAPWDT